MRKAALSLYEMTSKYQPFPEPGPDSNALFRSDIPGIVPIMSETNHTWPGGRDILFCLVLAAIAFGIFMLAKSLAVPAMSNVFAFDGKYYLDIAEHGYRFSGDIQERQNISFFPLEPIAIAAVRWLLPGQNDFLKVALLGAAALFGTLVGFFALLQNCVGKQAARLTSLVWALNPLAVYHFVGYTEPLFALGTVWCLVALRRGWLWTASIVAGVSMLGRPQAIVLVVFVGIELLRSAQWRPWRLLEGHAMFKVALLAIPIMAFASWMALEFHDSTLYLNAGAAWLRYYTSSGTYLPFFQAIQYFVHSVSVEAPALTDWKVMLGGTSLMIIALSLALSIAAPRREVLMYLSFLVFLAWVGSFGLANFGRHFLYLAPWAIILGTALAKLPGTEWRKWAALAPFVALAVLINVFAVMRFYRWEWVS